MKRLLIAFALACFLSGQALAGDIPSGGYTAPPPPPDEFRTTASSTSPGQIPCDVAGNIPTGGFAQQAEETLLDGFFTVVGWLT